MSKVSDQKQEEKNAIIRDIYDTVIKIAHEDVAEGICNSIYYDTLIDYIYLQIKNKNYKMLQLIYFISTKFDLLREQINENMINFLLCSFDDKIGFFEMTKWFEEFSYSDKEKMNDLLAAIYIQGAKFPEIKKNLQYIAKRLNCKDTIVFRTTFYMFDDDEVIQSYINPSKKDLDFMLVRCYQYDAVKTLKKIQVKLKLKFFNMSWHMLCPANFIKVMNENGRNPFKEENYSKALINYICRTFHWDYLPYIVKNCTNAMWESFKENFYMGYMGLPFVKILFHLMKKNNIPLTTLYSKNLLFNKKSCYNSYLVDNNLDKLFIDNGLLKNVIKVGDLSDTVTEANAMNATSLFVLYNEKKIINLLDVINIGNINYSKRYPVEIEYIDELIKNDDLGWNEDEIKNWNNFKNFIEKMINDIDIKQIIINRFNSYIPIHYSNLPVPYKLRFVNEIITMCKLIKIGMFKEDIKSVVDTCLETKTEYLKEIRENTRSHKKDPNVFYELPENPDIFDQFENLIENCDCYDLYLDKYNDDFINMLDNDIIRKDVKAMIYDYFVPLQKIQPIIYNYYKYYTDKECFFLE